MFTINVPTHLRMNTKGKSYPLNLNHYRNCDFRTLHRMKLHFSDLMTPKVKKLPRMEQVNLTYTLFLKDRRVTDTANVCCIVDKFFSDVMVTSGIIPDDNYNVVLSSTYRYGGIDQTGSRVEVTIEPVGSTPKDQTKEEDTMQIIIVQLEIEEAIRNHVLSQINVKEGMRIDIDLSATRGPEGFKATIDIVPEDEAPQSLGIVNQLKAEPIVADAVQPAKAKPGPKPKAAAEPAQKPAEVEDGGEAPRSPEPGVDELSAGEASVGEDNANGAVEEAAAPKKSLFGGLKTPVNAKPEAAATA